MYSKETLKVFTAYYTGLPEEQFKGSKVSRNFTTSGKSRGFLVSSTEVCRDFHGRVLTGGMYGQGRTYVCQQNHYLGHRVVSGTVLCIYNVRTLKATEVDSPLKRPELNMV